MEQRRLVDTKFAADYTAMSRREIQKAVKSGDLPAYRPRSKVTRIVFEELVAWFEKSKVIPETLTTA